jgi:hypothetical protein
VTIFEDALNWNIKSAPPIRVAASKPARASCLWVSPNQKSGIAQSAASWEQKVNSTVFSASRTYPLSSSFRRTLLLLSGTVRCPLEQPVLGALPLRLNVSPTSNPLFWIVECRLALPLPCLINALVNRRPLKYSPKLNNSQCTWQAMASAAPLPQDWNSPRNFLEPL